MKDLKEEFGEETKFSAYRGINGGLSPTDKYVEWLEKKVYAARSLGTVYIYPSDWKCSKMGGHPEMDDYEAIDLSDL